MWTYNHTDELYHYGVLGMKWGVRRYRRKDGSLTQAGKKRYSLSASEKAAYDKRDKMSRDAEKSRIPIGSRAKDTKLAADMLKEENEMFRLQREYDSFRPKERSRLEKSKDLVDAGSDLVNKAKNIERQSRSERTKVKMDLNSMSDQQMRSEINRALLEKQYNDMFAPQTRSKGREYVAKTLEVAGTVLTIGSSALGIALAIKELKK